MKKDKYWELSRSTRYSLLFALPLLVLYEEFVVLLSHGPAGGIRNGADVVLQQAVYAIAGRYEPIVFGVLLLGIGGLRFCSCWSSRCCSPAYSERSSERSRPTCCT
jgi:hypothetical protein